MKGKLIKLDSQCSDYYSQSDHESPAKTCYKQVVCINISIQHQIHL